MGESVRDTVYYIYSHHLLHRLGELLENRAIQNDFYRNPVREIMTVQRRYKLDLTYSDVVGVNVPRLLDAVYSMAERIFKTKHLQLLTVRMIQQFLTNIGRSSNIEREYEACLVYFKGPMVCPDNKLVQLAVQCQASGYRLVVTSP